jgi:hypothetical protein
VASGKSDVVLSDRRIRLGPQYDFDIGIGDTGLNELRIAFVLIGGSEHFVKVVRCTTGTITCTQPSEWTTVADSSDQWRPGIGFGFSPLTGSPVWQISYYSRQNFPGGNQVQLYGARLLPPGSSTTGSFRLENAQVPCPDLRGYWGDYDRMRGGIAAMWRGFSDSSHRTCKRMQYLSDPVFAALSMWSIL